MIPRQLCRQATAWLFSLAETPWFALITLEAMARAYPMTAAKIPSLHTFRAT
jgi:hypothetical protein